MPKERRNLAKWTMVICDQFLPTLIKYLHYCHASYRNQGRMYVIYVPVVVMLGLHEKKPPILFRNNSL